MCYEDDKICDYAGTAFEKYVLRGAAMSIWMYGGFLLPLLLGVFLKSQSIFLMGMLVLLVYVPVMLVACWKCSCDRCVG